MFIAGGLDMTVKCKIIKSIYRSQDISGITVYGLNFYYIGFENEIVKIIVDIFVDEEQIKTFCNLINSNDLDELHIDDVIYDALNADKLIR